MAKVMLWITEVPVCVASPASWLLTGLVWPCPAEPWSGEKTGRNLALAWIGSYRTLSSFGKDGLHFGVSAISGLGYLPWAYSVTFLLTTSKNTLLGYRLFHPFDVKFVLKNALKSSSSIGAAESENPEFFLNPTLPFFLPGSSQNSQYLSLGFCPKPHKQGGGLPASQPLLLPGAQLSSTNRGVARIMAALPRPGSGSMQGQHTVGSLLLPPVHGTMAQGSKSDDLDAPPSCSPGLGLRPALILVSPLEKRWCDSRLSWLEGGHFWWDQ